MYNKVVLVGYLTRDVEIRYSQSGSAIASVGIATSRRWKSQTGEMKDESMFIDLTFFGRTAEVANQYLRKGSKVLVDGYLVLQNWIGKDGIKRSKHSITVETLKMLDTKAESQNFNSGGYRGQPAQSQPTTYNSASYGNSGYNKTKQQPEQSLPPQEQQESSYIPKQTKPTPIPEIDINEDEIPF